MIKQEIINANITTFFHNNTQQPQTQEETTKTPKTADENGNVQLSLSLAALGFMVTALLVQARKRKNKK